MYFEGNETPHTNWRLGAGRQAPEEITQRIVFINGVAHSDSNRVFK